MQTKEDLIWLSMLDLFEQLTRATDSDLERNEKMRRLKMVKSDYEKVMAYFKVFVLDEISAKERENA